MATPAPTEEFERRKKLIEQYRAVVKQGHGAGVAWAKAAGVTPKQIHDWARRKVAPPVRVERRLKPAASFSAEQRKQILAEFKAARESGVLGAMGAVARKWQILQASIYSWAQVAGIIPRRSERRKLKQAAAPSPATTEGRKKIVVEYMAAIDSGVIGAAAEVARKYGVTSAQIHHWGASSKSPRKAPPAPRKILPAEVKRKAVEDYRSGRKSIQQLGQELGVDGSAVYKWATGSDGAPKEEALKTKSDELVAASNRALAKMNGHTTAPKPAKAGGDKNLTPEVMIRAFMEHLDGRGLRD